MCVVVIADKERPTPEQVLKMYEDNPAGAGIAWRETRKVGKAEERVVRWEKGLNLDQIQKMILECPLPFVAHFRIPSAGGHTPVLTHPFPISEGVELTMTGTTKGFVLFHNGHWNRWKDATYEVASRFGAKIPTGKWSDTRAMAWSAYHYGVGVLEFIEEKAVAFGPDQIEIIKGTSGWTRVDGFWASNTMWQHGRTVHRNAANYYTGYQPGGVGGHTPDLALDDDEGEAEGDVKGNVSRRVESGGASNVIPFDLEQALKMREAGTMSSKQFKRFRNEWERAHKKAKQHKNKAKLRAMRSFNTPRHVIVH